MSSKYLHRLTADDPETRQLIPTLLSELQRTFIRAKTPIGEAISPIISSWRLEKDGSFVAQFSPLAADRLPDASGLELLRAAKSLAQVPAAGLSPAA
ncbi:MAG: hypothetical protein V4729_12055 [Pseudomonadota bacterium]